MALRAGYYGLKKSLLNKVKELPGIKSIGSGLNLNSTTGELTATGSTVTIEANPEGEATDNLVKLEIGDDIYAIPDASKTYLTDDATESAIVDADYIPFLDSSAASGSGAPKKSTWSNFISKIKAKITEYVTWEANSILGARNNFNKAGTFSTTGANVTELSTGIQVTSTSDGAYSNVKHIYTNLAKSKNYRLRCNAESAASGVSGIGVGVSTDGTNYTTIVDKHGQENYDIIFNTDSNSYIRVVFFSAGATGALNARVDYTDVELILAEDTDDAYVPYSMTNRELTENKADFNSIFLPNLFANGVTYQGDLDDLKPGVVYCGDNATHAPSSYCIIITFSVDTHTGIITEYGAQLALKATGQNMYYRNCSNGTWSAWKEVTLA